MADYIKVSSNKIKTDADRIDELINSVPALIKALEQAMTRLNGCWEGSAWNAYQNTNAAYMEMLGEIYRYYGLFTANLLKAGQKYMRSEQDVMDWVDSVFV